MMKTGFMNPKRKMMLKLKMNKTVVGLLMVTLTSPAMALQVLDAVDHAELTAVISNSHVSRIALVDDRIERVVRGPDGFELEHDPHRGDVYLKPQIQPGREAWEMWEETGHPGVPGQPATELEKNPVYRDGEGVHLPAEAEGGRSGLRPDPDPFLSSVIR